jgi:hypothetical protein
VLGGTVAAGAAFCDGGCTAGGGATMLPPLLVTIISAGDVGDGTVY